MTGHKAGMIAAPQPEAVEAGWEVLRAGGNAVDAAVACAFVQTAVDPFMCGIAGFGTLHLFDPVTSRHLCLDFHARAPAAVRDDMWEALLEHESEDGFGFILKGKVNEIGYKAIATPETMRGLAAALERFGTIDLKRAMEPAIGYAREGWMIRPAVKKFWVQKEPAGRVKHIEYLRGNAETARIYLKSDGSLRDEGEVIRNPDMADTYDRIAAMGVDDFYQGQIAETIIQDMQANGGLHTMADLAGCGPEETDVIWGSYRGFKVAANPPPGGGVMILEMLNILEHIDLAALGHNSPHYIAAVAEAMKIATVDKDRFVGDPRFVDVPLDRLLSKDYAAACAARIKAGEKCHVPRVGLDEKTSPENESRDTTHICAVDGQGMCVSMTHSLGMPSGVVTPGLGFMYNGCMGVFDPRPGRTGSLAPGKARFTSMAPTILFDEQPVGLRPRFVVGAPGGTYIAMGILQAILNHVDFGMDAQQAVAAPRFCATSDIIEVVNRIPRSVQRELEGMGYPIRRYHVNYHFGGVHAIRIGEDGALDGGADPGRDGMALGA